MAKDSVVILHTRADWTTWNGFVKAKLMKKRVWDLVNDAPEDIIADGAGVAPAAAPARAQERMMACGIILETLHPTVRELVIDIDDPHDMMTRLRETFFRATPANLSEMQARIWNLEMPPSRKVDDTIAIINRMVNDIVDQGVAVDDPSKAAILHNCLKKSSLFYALISQINARAAIPGAQRLTYEELCDAARTFETTLSPTDYAADSGHALMATAKTRPAATSQNKMRCRSCKATGHTNRDCQKFPRGICWNCRRRGHVKSDCPDLAAAGQHTALIATTVEPDSFILDTGATVHLVNRSDYLKDSYPSRCEVTGVHRNSTVKAAAQGSLFRFPGTALLMPNIKENLLSVLQLGSFGWKANFAGPEARLVSPDGTTFKATAEEGALYRLDTNQHQVFLATATTPTQSEDVSVWHCRLGHPEYDRLKEICDMLKLTDTSSWPKELPPCTVCLQCKLTKARVNHASTHVESDRQLRPGQLLNVDLIGPMEPSTPGGYIYDLHVIDRCTRMKFRAPLVRRSQAAKAFADMIDREFTPFGRTPERVHCDRGGEFTGSEWAQMCKERGYKCTFSSTDTPAHNGIVERAHRSMVTIARCLLANSNLPATFWTEAMTHACFLSNAMPTNGLPDRLPPFQHWTGEAPVLRNMLTFGSEVYFLLTGGRFNKVAGRGIYLGPAHDTTGGAARVWNPITNRVNVTRDIRIIEPTTNKLPHGPQISHEMQNLIIDGASPAVAPAIPASLEPARATSENDTDGSDSDESDIADTPLIDDNNIVDIDPVVVAVRTEQLPELRQRYAAYRARRAPPVAPEPAPVTATPRRSARISAMQTAMVATANEPNGYYDAMARPDASEWMSAMYEECESLNRQNVYQVVERRPGMRLVSGRWVHKIKLDADNNPVRYKSRLTARGFTQIPGVDFDQVSAPVISKEAIRIFFAAATQQKWKMEQFDVKTAYLFAPLDTDIYMEVPEGFLEIWGKQLHAEEQQILNDGGCLLLKKALYGLKQSGRCWYETLCSVMKEHCGMSPSTVEPCLFIGDGCAALIHVDDGIIAAYDGARMDAFFSIFGSHFDIARLGAPRYYTGITIEEKQNGDIVLHQKGYIDSMATSFAAGINNKVTPMPFGATLPDNGPPGDARSFREIIGSLLYAAVGTRPDISTAVSILSRHMNDPTVAHISRARGIVAYLAGTASLGLRFKREGELSITVYCDASFAPDEHQRRSRTGYVIFVNGTPVAWRSQLQSLIAGSTAEAEYIAMYDAVREALYVQRVLAALPGIQCFSPITVFEDNQVAKRMAEEVCTRRSKHVEIKFHFVREQVKAGTVVIKDCRSADMIADLFTKPLPRSQFQLLRNHLLPLEGEC